MQDRSVIREDVEGEPWLYPGQSPSSRSRVGAIRFFGSPRQSTSVAAHRRGKGDCLGRAAIEDSVGGGPDRKRFGRRASTSCWSITGGPGVGKTTLVRSILEIFCRQEAEMRAGGSHGPGRQAVGGNHRAAPPRPSTACWSSIRLRGTSNEPAAPARPATCSCWMRSSMVDVVLGHQFLRAVPSRSLRHPGGRRGSTSLGRPGSVLADLIASGVVPVVRLTEIFRQAAKARSSPPPMRSTRAGCPN